MDFSPDQTVTRLAPAKLNLALHVTGRRQDGYHLIESLAVFTRFGDRLGVSAADNDLFSVSGPFAADVPTDASNLVLSARDALRAAFPDRPCPPVAIALEKNLPVASGVGGGSSDAAAALHALAGLWGIGDAAALSRIGLSLGADVPMCLAAKPLIARGIGEEISMLAGFPALALVLVNPGVAVSTADVFSALERRDGEKLPPFICPSSPAGPSPREERGEGGSSSADDPLPPSLRGEGKGEGQFSGAAAGLDFHSLRNWLETTRNDLEQPARALQPEIGAALAALDRAGSGFTRMSGSGATCFGLFETGNVAKRAAIAIRARHPGWFVAATRGMASEAVDEAS